MPAILDVAPDTAWDRAYVDVPADPDLLSRTGSRLHARAGHRRAHRADRRQPRRHVHTRVRVRREARQPHLLGSLPAALSVAARPGDREPDACAGDQLDWYDRALPALAPDIVFLVHEPYDDVPKTIVLPNGGHGTSTDPQTEQTLIDASARGLRRLQARYPKVVIIEPDPRALDPLSCLSTGKTSDQCSYRASTKVTPLVRYYRARSDHKRIWSLDFDKLICPRFPRCDTIVNGVIVKRDPTHLTGTYSAAIGPAVDLLLHQQGVLGSSDEHVAAPPRRGGDPLLTVIRRTGAVRTAGTEHNGEERSWRCW